jgi:aminoglycoside phosphotransferase (APT) family kinase protein
VTLRPHRPPLAALSSDETALVEAVARRLKLNVSAAFRVRKGKSRATYRVETTRGAVALRVARDQGSLRVEADVVEALRSVGFERVPRLLGHVSSVDGVLFAAYEWVEGFSAKPLAPEVAVDGRIARAAGIAVRELDDAFGEVELHGSALPSGSAWAAGVVAALARVAQEHEVVTAALELIRGRAAPADTNVIHGDIRFANLVFDERGDVRAFLDFEHVMRGTPRMECAFAVRNLFAVEAGGRSGESRLDVANAIRYLRAYDATLGTLVAETDWAELRDELVLAVLGELRFVLDEADRLAPGRFRVLLDTATSQLEWAIRR